MKNTIKRIGSVLIFFIISLGILTESALAVNNVDKNINFKSITIEDGLSQTSIEYLFQDSKGYMWIGTVDGLNRYNGHEFEVFKYKEDSENSLIGNYIAAINEDTDGNIWVGTSKGLNKINPTTKEIKSYFPGKDGCNISHYNITEILLDSKGDIYVATVDGLNKYDKNNDNFIRVYNSINTEKSLSNQFIYSITEDINGCYWVGTENGLNKIEKDGRVTKYYQNESKNSISDNVIFKVYADKRGSLWIGTYSGGLNRLDLNTNTIEVFKNIPGDSKSLPGNYVRSILRDSRDMLWVATDNGFCKLDEKKKEFTTYEARIYDPQSILSNNILSLCEDKSGTIWVGTYDGISLFNPDNIFRHYKNDPFNTNSLSEDMMAGIYQDNDGLLWVGTVHNGINIIDRDKNIIQRINSNLKDQNSISDNNIREIVGIDNEIWIATENGLNKYDKSTGKYTRYNSNGSENSLIHDDVKSLYIDNEGILWIGTRDGLCSFDRKNKFTHYTDILKANGVDDTMFADIYQDKDGIMWFGLGLEGGLIKYNKTTKEMKEYRNNEKNKKSLSYNAIKSIISDSKGNLWIGTQYGLNKFDKNKEEFTRYTESDGLCNNFIYGILIDSEYNPWISTNYGLSKFDIEDNKFINFNVTDGLQGNEFNGHSYYKSPEGEMFFGGINGLTTFYPEDLVEKKFIPMVNIESIYNNGEEINVEDNIYLKYDTNQFQINFFMPDYRNTSKIQYAYRLEGLDNEWVSSENRNYANYTNLQPGSYKFLVKGRNSTGEWSEVRAIRIKVSNPPWRTPIAYIIYIVILVTVLYIVWNRVKILDSLVEQRTKELDSKLKENEELYAKLIRNEKYKNNYFVNLSHELRTPLNVILSTQQLITKLNEDEKPIPKEKINYYMNTLKRNSNRLLKLINNIIDTSKIESGSYKLDIKENDIVYLVEEAALSMKDFIENNGIELIIDPEVEEKVIECDYTEIEKSVVNLIANAAKFTPYGGKIQVKLFDLGDMVEITVKDTGIGIDEKYHEAIFNRFGQAYNEASEEHGGSGLGLTLTKQLVNLHYGDIRVNSKIGEGSEFIITLPVKHNRN
ncbi:ligand-binding sensor domain-containing protein [Clostridium chauvoei]|uniref:ligand-binding sensor domain-containing protein n=1 Tax=Clostridium chauvoei TaxID=46867 RepID=UPI001C855716|nr:sensor histidine kinase [Clostridium chauvoei]MBX7379325.1 histidine kinase [Clostridium chauvoei]MBX7384415.1 histidine kinase [Clostridium chauvoei]MBX7397002.1 histidine kinase [Clostridium chauvoei]MBX7399517.1 histidine kinase [Clostridium chauvoei]MBX7424773.1 histidine kinase [Clostridium chauvoei]